MHMPIVFNSTISNHYDIPVNRQHESAAWIAISIRMYRSRIVCYYIFGYYIFVYNLPASSRSCNVRTVDPTPPPQYHPPTIKRTCIHENIIIEIIVYTYNGQFVIDITNQ